MEQTVTDPPGETEKMTGGRNLPKEFSVTESPFES
jgi:hypothetical protein